MNKAIWVVLIIVLAVGAFMIWGTRDSQQDLANQPGVQEPANDRENRDGGGRVDYNAQWQASAHAKVVENTVRDGCIQCHTEQGFINPDVKAEEITGPKAQTCNACHDFSGANNENKLRKVTPVSLPNGVVMDRGDSNLCVACHNSRRNMQDAATRAGRKAPHGSPEGDMLMGTNAWEFGADVVSYQNSAHTGFENACVVCHMAKSPPEGQAGFNEVGGHTFRVKSNDAFNPNACIGCHPETVSADRPAYGDYDGNKKMEGIQSEVEGLLELLKAEIEKRIPGGGGKLSESHGNVVFLKADGTEIPPEEMDEKLYLAAYNYFFVEADGSLGVHNPPYAVTLLQQSYKAITGKDVPNAEIRR